MVDRITDLFKNLSVNGNPNSVSEILKILKGKYIVQCTSDIKKNFYMENSVFNEIRSSTASNFFFNYVTGSTPRGKIYTKYYNYIRKLKTSGLIDKNASTVCITDTSSEHENVDINKKGKYCSDCYTYIQLIWICKYMEKNI